MPDSPDQRPASSRAGSAGPGWTPPAIDELQALLPQYEILSMIGRGGMGAVFKGRQKSLDRMVAIKILPPGLDDAGTEFTARFRNEARLMAKLNHPGIVSVHDFGEMAEGQFYFVMEYVDGTDVARMISTSGRLPADYALTITAHVCDALGYAHANGVIHRDIKPANILINKQGQVKVTDFGLARHEDASLTAGLTKTGVTMGTPDFIAPEALTLGADVDGRADLYAVGVMLYQMLTGDIPRGLFLMPSVKTKGEIDPRFDRIITRAMQTEREERYQQASEIRKDLDVIQSSPRLKQDASKVVAAVPQAAVQNMPDQRSAAGEKKKAEPSEARQTATGCPQGLAKRSQNGKQQSKTGLYLGIAVAVVLIGAMVFMRSGTRQRSDQPHGDRASIGSLATSATDRLATSSSSDGWIDGLAEWLAVPGNATRSTLQREGTAWRYKGPESVRLGARLSPPYNLANVAVRLTFQQATGSISLRTQKEPGNFYQATLYSHGPSEIFLEQNKERTSLAKFKASPGFDKNASHVMEFRAEGDVLMLSVDGQSVGSVKDTTYTSGTFNVSPLNALIEKLEYRDLGSAAAVAESARIPTLPIVGSLATSATLDGGVWADALAEYFAKTTTDGRLVQEAGGARVMANGGTAFTGSRQFFTDMSLRVTAQGGNEGAQLYWGALLSYGQAKAYSARVTQNGTAELRLLMPVGGGSKELQSIKLPAGFDYTARHTLEFRAIGDEFTFILDEVKLGSVRDTTLTGSKSPSFDGSVGGLIEKFEYKSIPKLSGSPAPADGGGPWVDAIAEWLANPGNASSGKLKPEGTGWRMEKGGSIGISTNRPGRAMGNVAVRTIWRDATALNINLRGQPDGNTYGATLWDTGASNIRVTLDKKITEHAGTKPPASFKAGELHTLEFRAQGDELTILVDGQVTASVKDATLTSGQCVVICGGGWLEKIEYRDLPTTTQSAATNSSATVPATPPAAPPAPPVAPTDPKLAALLPNYTKAITDGLAAAAPADKPAFEAELVRLKNNTPLPDAAEDAKLPAELKRLRGILRSQLK